MATNSSSLTHIENANQGPGQGPDPASSGADLRASRYNHFIQYNKDAVVGYNFLYRTMVRVPALAFPEVERLLRGLSCEEKGTEAIHSGRLGIPDQWLDALREAHFIIDRTFDEVGLIKFRYYRSLFANDFLSLIVLPTLSCNFQCPYCFEFKRAVFMNPEVEDALVRWVEHNFRRKRRVHIAWFGGEPLLAKPIIFRLTERLQGFCNKVGANYQASLTTNGFFLDDEFQHALSPLGIKNVQVTLDGDRANHDVLRRQKNGAGSFDRIFENICAFCGRSPDAKLTLRVNCGDDNYDGIETLLGRFPLTVRERAAVFFRWIWANKASGYREFASIRRGKEPFRGLARLYGIAKALGWHTANPTASVNDGYCEVDYLDHFSIGPDGNVFLCSHTFEKSEAIGSVLAKMEVIRPDAKGVYARWYAFNPFDDEECINCPVLPICWGGCRKARFENRRECIEERQSLDMFVRSIAEERLLPAAQHN